MRIRPSTFLSALAIVGAAAHAHAQACCAGAGAITPARLAMHEDGLAGTTLRVAGAYGSFSSAGVWVGTPSRASEYDFQQDVFASARVAKSGQVAVLVPLVATRREVSSTTEIGGGLGDIAITGRWDFVTARPGQLLPGVAAIVGAIAPTGKPADLSAQPLATDATGLGVPQAVAGVALERIVGPWLFDVIGTVTVRAPRAVQGIDSLLAPRWTAILASAYVFRSGAALSLALSYAVETDGWLAGVQVPRSGRRDPQVAVAAIVPFVDRWRLLFSVTAHPPIPGVGQNTLAMLGASTTLTRVWW